MNIGIVGLGLIGGSMARAIKRSGAGHTVYACNRSKAPLEAALGEGVVDAVLTDETLPLCDLVLVALYPRSTVDYVLEHAPLFSLDTAVVDLCGVKGAVCPECFEAAREHGFAFIGGHPMAGREISGFSASQEELFDGASMILVPPEDVDPDLMSSLHDFFLSLGFGRITVSTMERHDRVIAYTSQLAHVVSNAYVQSETSAMHGGFSAGSFKDLTRVARLKVDMWTELFLDNRDALSCELRGLIDRLSAFESAISSGDAETLAVMLERGVEMKEASENV